MGLRREEPEGSGLTELPCLRDERIYEELLRYSENEKVKELASKLNIHMRGFENFTDTSLKELMRISGVDRDTAILISVVADICRRAIEQREKTRLICSPIIAARYAASKLLVYDREVVLLMCLTDDLHCEHCRVISDGESFSTEINAYTMVCLLMSYHTNIAILAHNHLTEGPDPSEMDVMVTNSFAHNLKNVGMLLLDHIIISGGYYTSMAANGAFRGETEKIRSVYCPLTGSNAVGRRTEYGGTRWPQGESEAEVPGRAHEGFL